MADRYRDPCETECPSGCRRRPVQACDGEERVVDRQDRSARIAEDVLYALILERTDDHLRAAELYCSAIAARGQDAAQCRFILVHDGHSSVGPKKRKGRCRPLVTSRRSETRSPSPAQRLLNKYAGDLHSRHPSVQGAETRGASNHRQAISCKLA